MQEWPHEVSTVSPWEIQKYCVADIGRRGWQQFRLELKGLRTEVKLDRLAGWRASHLEKAGNDGLPRDVQVQIDNYINALLRGGQLVRRNGQIVVQR